MEYAVIFDMDGVLVDSFHAHYESWRIVAAEHGRRITEAEFAATFGKTSREVIAAWWPDNPKSEAEIHAIDDRKEAVFRELLEKDFPVMPGARELLQALRRHGIGTAVGSSGPPENVDFVLDRGGLRELFGAVVHGRDVERGKPDPQVFLLAAQRLGVPPEACAVIEDAALGIEAAHRAGMIAIGLASTGRTRCELNKAELVIDSLSELAPERITALIRVKGNAPPLQTRPAEH